MEEEEEVNYNLHLISKYASLLLSSYRHLNLNIQMTVETASALLVTVYIQFLSHD